MRYRHTILVIATAGLLLNGCGGEEEARQYAEQLAAILKNYQQKVSEQMKEQTGSYQEIAQVLDRSKVADQIGNLDSERAERVLTMRERLLSDEKYAAALNAASLRKELFEYSQVEFEGGRELLMLELDSYKRFLVGVQALERDATAIKQLQKQLEDLSKDKGWFQRMKDAAAFGQKVKSEFDRLSCEGAKSQETELQATLKRLDAQIADPANAATVGAIKTQRTDAAALLKEVQERKNSLSGCT